MYTKRQKDFLKLLMKRKGKNMSPTGIPAFSLHAVYAWVITAYQIIIVFYSNIMGNSWPGLMFTVMLE